MNFGVISTANIAQAAVMPAIQASDHDLLAVASRDRTRAEDIAESFDVPRAYGSYEQLLADEDIDAVYNPLPNSLHAKWTKRAADAGLDVLCEKPLGVDANEAREMTEYCEDHDVVLMEAFVYQFHPRTERTVEIANEKLQMIRSVEATFKFPVRGQPDNIRLNPDLAGGSLMDVGCYAVSAARLFLEEPAGVYARMTDSRGCGVDTNVTALFDDVNGATAQISASFDTQDTQRYRVEAENGWLEAESVFVPRGDNGVQIEYAIDGRHTVESFDPTDQYQLEVEHFADCVTSNTTPRTDGSNAIQTMQIIDACYESCKTNRRIEVDTR